MNSFPPSTDLEWKQTSWLKNNHVPINRHPWRSFQLRNGFFYHRWFILQSSKHREGVFVSQLQHSSADYPRKGSVHGLYLCLSCRNRFAGESGRKAWPDCPSYPLADFHSRTVCKVRKKPTSLIYSSIPRRMLPDKLPSKLFPSRFGTGSLKSFFLI